MFTGIIEETGTISSIIRKGQGLVLAVFLKNPFSDLAIGDSITVDGVCLTITKVARNTFTADVSEETVRSTSFSNLKTGQKVNLERALTLNKRVGGHIVTGHVDCVVELREKIIRGDSCEYLFAFPQKLRKYLVPKGSVSLDGISLTVAKLSREGFSVSVIPHTLQYTTLSQKQIGDKFNLEADILSKYLEGLMLGEPITPTEKVFIDSGILPMGIIDN